MTRLRTAKLAGVKGERRKINLDTSGNPASTGAICYGQWGIHGLEGSMIVTHTPTGRSVAMNVVLEASARTLVGRLLAVREFKTMRAKAEIADCLRVYQEWRRGN